MAKKSVAQAKAAPNAKSSKKAISKPSKAVKELFEEQASEQHRVTKKGKNGKFIANQPQVEQSQNQDQDVSNLINDQDQESASQDQGPEFDEVELLRKTNESENQYYKRLHDMVKKSKVWGKRPVYWQSHAGDKLEDKIRRILRCLNPQEQKKMDVQISGQQQLDAKKLFKLTPNELQAYINKKIKQATTLTSVVQPRTSKCAECQSIFSASPTNSSSKELSSKVYVGSQKVGVNKYEKIYASIPCAACQTFLIQCIRRAAFAFVQHLKTTKYANPSDVAQLGNFPALHLASKNMPMSQILSGKCQIVSFQLLASSETVMRLQFTPHGVRDAPRYVAQHLVWSMISGKWGPPDGVSTVNGLSPTASLINKVTGVQHSKSLLSMICKEIGKNCPPPTGQRVVNAVSGAFDASRLQF